MIDRGTAVEVIAHNVTAAKTGVLPIRSRLEVPLAGHPRAAGFAPKDATVKVVELEDGNLSVKVGFEHPAVIGLAKFAQASQIGPDVHLIFPRIVPADGTALVMPEPTIPADLVKQVDAALKPVAPVAGPPPPPPAITPERTPVASTPERTPVSAERTPDVPAKVTPEFQPNEPASWHLPNEPRSIAKPLEVPSRKRRSPRMRGRSSPSTARSASRASAAARISSRRRRAACRSRRST